MLMAIRKSIYPSILLLVIFGIVRGDTPLTLSEGKEGGYLSLRGTDPSNVIVIDSSVRQRISVDSIPLSAGHHHIRIYDQARWEGPVMDTTVEIIGQEIVLRVPETSLRLTLLSGPVQASVKLNDSIIGHTPLSLASPLPPNARIVLTAIGYEEAVVPSLKGGITIVDLKMLQTNDQHTFFRNDGQIGRHRDWIYTSITSAVVSGVTAVYAKQKANYFDDQFAQSRDPALRSKRDRYDIASGIALAVAEVSFVFLSYLLLSQ